MKAPYFDRIQFVGIVRILQSVGLDGRKAVSGKMRLNEKIITGLTASFWPKNYLRVLPMSQAASPLAMATADSQFSSPLHSFQLIYIAFDLASAIAETVCQDDLGGRVKAAPTLETARGWGVATISATSPLNLVDLRTTGLNRPAAPTDEALARTRSQGRRLSQAIHEATDVDGILYLSRLSGMPCAAIYDRAVRSKLTSGPLEEMILLDTCLPALTELSAIDP